ncbi:MAG: membrane protein insertase YidC [Clostridia bacterium]|nr:membrane protein insertase YidC [Clostridia bacterium]
MVTLVQLFASSGPALTNWIGKLIYKMYEGIGNFGWTVVLFTIALKALLSPLDIWQKRTMMKNNRAMKLMAPEIEKLKKTYANAPDVLNQKQMELYKKHGYSMTGGCLPALITIVIFFIVFSGFNAAVRYENERIVYSLTQSYVEISAEEGMTPEVLDERMVEAYNEEKQGWLWIKNVFMSDTYANPVPTFDKFVGKGLGQIGATLPAETRGLNLKATKYDNGYDAILMPAMNSYNKSKFFDMKHWNGYFILPIISIVLSILSVKITKVNQPEMPAQTDENGNPAKTGQGMMKAMNWMMPIMMGVFALFYSSAFCIYMVMNSLITVLFNVAYNAIAKKQDEKAEEKRLSATFKR